MKAIKRFDEGKGECWVGGGGVGGSLDFSKSFATVGGEEEEEGKEEEEEREQ